MKKPKTIVVRVDEGANTLSHHLLDLKQDGKKEKFVKNASSDFQIVKSPKKIKDTLLIVSIFNFFIRLFFLSFKSKFKKSKINKEFTKPAWDIGFISLSVKPPLYWRRAMASFIILSFILASPIKVFSYVYTLQEQKDQAIEQGLDGYNELKQSNYSAASQSFKEAKDSINNLGFVLKHIISVLPGVGDKLTLGNALLTFGENISEAAFYLDEGFKNFDEESSFIDKIKFLKSKTSQALPYILIASSIISKIDGEFLPVDISFLQDMVFNATRALLVFSDFSDTLLNILGNDHFQRYLFVFQNNNELRPTGGFIGSFAILDVDKGEIKKMEIPGGGSYDIQGQLKELVISPEPFHLINSKWEFQDSNWFPDFPESAKKIMWFYEKAGGPTVDGVVAINATLMEDILNIIGPIDMPEYGRIIDSSNFIDETQKIVELEYDKEENKPKQFIADLAPRLIESIMDVKTDKIEGLFGVLHKAVLSKDIMVYSRDEEIQHRLASFGLSGGLKDVLEFTDYLMVVDTNIAGQKTDGKIEKEIEHSSIIEADGSIVDTVTIKRKHTGIKGEVFSGVRNVNYLRIYVPLGSELLDARGFKIPPADLFESPEEGFRPDKDLERVQGPIHVDPSTGVRINNEFNRTVFGNWIMVDPGEEVIVTFKYRLPNKLLLYQDDGLRDNLLNSLDIENSFLTYKFLVEKQSGAKNTTFKSRVKLEDGRVVARVGTGIALQDDGWQYEAPLEKDIYYGVVLE